MSLSARDLFEAGRLGAGPSDDARARVRSKLVRRLGPSVAIAAASASVATRAAAGSASATATASFVKAAALCILGGSLVGAGYAALRRPPHVDRSIPMGAVGTVDRPPPVAAPIGATATLRAPGDLPSLPEGVAAPIAASPQPTPQPSQPSSATRKAPVVAAPALAMGPSPTGDDHLPAETSAGTDNALPGAPPVDGLQGELALVRAARDALRAGQPEVALERMDQHRREYPNGALAEERDALRVSAICLLGRPEGRAEAQAFLANHPESPFVARIRETCPR